MRPFQLALSIVSNRMGRIPRPSWCTYLVTYRCNARCTMCDSWRIKPGEELTPEEVEEVFGKIGRLDVVRLTGGEPFLRLDMVEIAEAVLRQSRPATIHTTTNGSFPDRVEDFIRRFSRPDLLRYMVSFDGLPEVHDENRGEEVTFDLAVETVRRIAALREDYGVQVSANHTVINGRSLEDNAGIRAILAEHDCPLHSVLAYADSSMYGAKLRGKRADHLIVPRGYPLHPALKGADVVGFVEGELRRAEEFSDPLMKWGKKYYLQGLLERVRGDETPSRNPSCVELRSHIRLLPDASIPVCQFNTEIVGNLRDQAFEEVWHSALAAESRAWVDGCPGCWAECEVMPNAIYSGDLLKI